MQHLTKEVWHLAERNHRVLQAECGVLHLHSLLGVQLVALERFLRIALGVGASAGKVLPTLLDEAAGKKRGWISFQTREALINHVKEGRRWELHRHGGVWGEFDGDQTELLRFSIWLLDLLNRLMATVDVDNGAKRGAMVAPVQPNVAIPANVQVLPPAYDLHCLRTHNLQFREGDDQGNLLLLAEGILCVTLVEGACRRLLPSDSSPKKFVDVLEELKSSVFRDLPNPDLAIQQLASVKNTTAHGDFERAAQHYGTDVAGYFKRYFASEVEQAHTVYRSLVAVGTQVAMYGV